MPPAQTIDQMATQAGVDPVAAKVEQQSKSINPDVAVGNLLTGSLAKSNPSLAPRTDSSGSVVGYGPTPAGSGVVGSSADVRNFESGVTGLVNGLSAPSASADAARTASNDYLTQIDQMAADLEQRRRDAVSSINQQFDVQKADTQDAQKNETGATDAALLRVGGYLGTQMSGVGVLNNLARSQRAEISSLEAKRAAAVQAANSAIDDKQFELAFARAQEAKDLEKTIYERSKTAFEQMVSLNKEIRENDKYMRETASQSLDAIAASGADPSPEYLQAVAEHFGITADEARGMFVIAKTERDIKNATDMADLQNKRMAQYQALSNILNSTPIGTPISIDGFTYYGTKGAGDLQVNDVTGEASIFAVNPQNGQVEQKYVGNVGAKRDGWDIVMIGNEPFAVNASKGEYKSLTGMKSELAELVPPGAYQSLPGQNDAYPDLPLQCGQLVNLMTVDEDGKVQTVGSTLKEKEERVDKSITDKTVVAGNVVVTTGGATGHVAVVNRVYVDPSGRTKLVLSEANWAGPGVVSHDREIYADDPTVRGFIGSSFAPNFAVGTDNALAQAVARADALDAPATKPGSDSIKFDDPVLSDIYGTLGPKQGSEADTTLWGKTLQEAAKSGDPARVRQVVQQGVVNTLPATEQTAAAGWFRTVNSLENIKSDIAAYKAAGGSMNIFKGNAKDIADRLGVITDEKLVKIATKIQSTLMNYRRSLTGAAFGEYETAEYEKLFPSTKGSVELNDAKIDALIAQLRADSQATYEFRLGTQGYNAIFNANLAQSNAPTGQTAATGSTYTSTSGKTYNLPNQ